ncbi:MAG: Uma2 family endonuclease [Planctomycetota bacterium]|nr:MAG: Uma2 family endonuclease [Planctomycetota bacterium]REJ95528.1 MAG: Uma2 family endonuclease [Planctomycetota bacterium]REK21914.1 MAG: Uma2 family endonuclease [Planctomycetota bacterium]REK32174.1 MAG: Uma2 family endonuclease [Planctomycetota bacterium]
MSTATPATQPIAESSAEPRSAHGTPVWEIAHLYPLQGHWDEQDYLSLDAGRLVEFDDGFVEFLPMPSLEHQAIARFLFRLLDQFVAGRRLGEAYFAPLSIRLRSGKYREPDLVFVKPNRKRDRRYIQGADLVVEVVSDSAADRQRDLETKRAEYAEAAIPEYWIVDPVQKTITVLTLDGEEYRVHGEFKPGETASSVLLEGFTVDVTACFAAADDAAGN